MSDRSKPDGCEFDIHSEKCHENSAEREKRNGLTLDMPIPAYAIFM